MTKSTLPRVALAALCAATLYTSRPAVAAVGDMAPEINATGWVNGGPVSIAGSLGHVIVLEFWATW